MMQNKSYKNPKITMRKNWNKFVLFITQNFKYFIGILVVIWLIIWTFYFSKKYIFNWSNDIKSVSVSDEDVYINETIKKTLEDFFIGSNYYVSKLNKRSLLNDFADKNINIINNLTISKQWQNVIVDIDYKAPSAVLSLSGQLWWYASWYFFELDPKFSIFSGNIIINVSTFSGNDISSIFFETKPEALMQQMKNIYAKIAVKDNFWIPSAYKIWITTQDDKLVYFDIKKNIFDQIQKYNFVKDNYKNYAQIKELDVWTIEDSVFIK